MKIVKPNAHLWDADMHPLKLVERVGRTCYKSEDKITDDSYKNFVRMLVNRHHFAMLEHGTLYLKWQSENNFIINILNYICHKLHFMSYLNMERITYNASYITGSFRAFYEYLEFLKFAYEQSATYCLESHEISAIAMMEYTLKGFLTNKYPEVFESISCIPSDPIYQTYIKSCGPEEELEIITADLFKREVEESVYLNEKEKQDILMQCIRHSVDFICDRGVSHELVRHRPASFGQESTRYCNYGNGKFGGEISFIEPCFWEPDSELYTLWKKGCEISEQIYMEMLAKGAIPQEARDILDHSVKTEITLTANEKEWQHILNLRLHGTTGAPHPQMKEIMELAYPELTAASDNRLK
jgi:thymidylate synthase ThyX